MGLTAVNPADNAGGIMTWKIIVNGTIIPDVCAILSIKVHNKVNEIPTAAIVMADDSQDSEFALSSSSIFIPGGSIVIAAGYDTVDETIFSGKITAQSMRIEQSVGSVLEIECSDEATNMHQDKKSRTFIDKKDSDVILTVISENRLLGTVTRTETEYAEVIQYGQTDWEFVLAKAKANNMMVITQDGTITVVPPSVDRESVLTVTNGVSILGFEGQWNVSSAPDMIYRDFSKIQGNVRFQGCALAKTGTCIDMEGLGTRFSGKHLVSAVTHSIEDGDWITEATIGLTACRVTETTGPATHDILSSARGLFNGTVKQIHDDPKGHYRILVDLPLPGALSAGIWARPANFYATSGAGAFFLPEVGDEVVVGFLNEDPRYPIILGSLYSNPEHKPHASLVPDEQNSLKAIVSKSGLTVSFDDKDKILSISSPGMNTIVVNDKEKEISIKDQHANSIVMSTDGIAINSLKDIKIGAGGIISINGTGNIGITSKADVTVSALNISETANVGYTAKGTTSAEVSASGQVSIKGAMVMIN